MTPVLAHPRPSEFSASAANAPPIYLDNQSTTRVDPRVLEAMLPYFTEHFGNPHSASHPYGRLAAEAVEQARGEIAALIRADPREIIFTSGATEANNLAIKGAAHFARAHPQKGQIRDHIVTLQTEHKCVLESCKALEAEGFGVTYLPVEPSGLVSLAALEAALSERTLLLSVMAAHNEIGIAPAAVGNWRIMPFERRAVPHRRGAGVWQDPARCRGDENRSAIDLRP